MCQVCHQRRPPPVVPPAVYLTRLFKAPMRSRDLSASSFRNNVFLSAHPNMLRSSVADEVLMALAHVTRTPEVRGELDLELFELHLLDSLGVVELLVDLSERLEIELSPAEFDRQTWGTPRTIIAYLEARFAGAPAS